MSAPLVSADELSAAKSTLKASETTEKGAPSVDPQVLHTYQMTFAKHGGDKAKICDELGLNADEIKDGYFASVESFTRKTLGA
mmetsp:Transcript_29347/g.76895  ORF Transcript_29347/g.76895 Transcript_29347/m.76895 type:complete len:83 (+) Transcript_29347:86-334(+)